MTTVAFSILNRLDFRATVHPYLEKLNLELGETVHLTMLDGVSVCFVDAIEGSKIVRTASRLGMSLPATTTASGKAMLADLSPAELDSLYPAEELVTLTRPKCCHPKRAGPPARAGPPPRLLMELRGERSRCLVGCGVVPRPREPAEAGL